jgi:hypothetical protein
VLVPAQRNCGMLRLVSVRFDYFGETRGFVHIRRIFPLRSHFVLVLCQPNMHKI